MRKRPRLGERLYSRWVGFVQMLRRVVTFDNERYMVVYQTDVRVVLDKLTGDISDYRKLLNVSQSRMAELLGVAKSTLSRYENGKIPPPVDIRVKCDALIYEEEKKLALHES
jgi:DNA-binding XRE family transcriptional regulator